MNKRINFINIILVATLVLIHSFCSTEDTLFQEFERNWKECYDDNFHFEEDTVQLDGEYVKCKLDDYNVLINAENSEYIGITYHGSMGTVSNPDITLSIDSSTQYQILIAFFKPALLTGFCIQLDYPKDSLNYTIQKTFSEGKIQCSSNFMNRGIEYLIMTSCKPNGRIIFSTLYSTRVNQEIIIENFTSTLHDGKWHYHLEYSSEDLEITNSSWNSRSKVGDQGQKLKSKVLIENLPIKNLHGMVEFEFPEEE